MRRPVLWIALGGFVLSVLASYWVWERATTEAETELATSGTLVVEAIGSAVDGVGDRLIAVGGLYQASELVTRDEFAEFVATFGDNSGVVAIAHARIVGVEMVPAVVNELRETYADYELFEYDLDGERVPVAWRPSRVLPAPPGPARVSSLVLGAPSIS